MSDCRNAHAAHVFTCMRKYEKSRTIHINMQPLSKVLLHGDQGLVTAQITSLCYQSLKLWLKAVPRNAERQQLVITEKVSKPCYLNTLDTEPYIAQISHTSNSLWQWPQFYLGSQINKVLPYVELICSDRKCQDFLTEKNAITGGKKGWERLLSLNWIQKKLGHTYENSSFICMALFA